jgi:hypothetical protein
MNKITLICPVIADHTLEKTIPALPSLPGLIEKTVLWGRERPSFIPPHCEYMQSPSLASGKVLNTLIEMVKTDYMLMMDQPRQIHIPPRTIERLMDIAESTGAGILYSDYHQETRNRLIEHPLIDYHPGSIRDDFDFGHVTLFSMPAVRRSLDMFGNIPEVDYAGLYDLRLKVSINHPILHVQEPLYTKYGLESADEGGSRGTEIQFDYVDPRNQSIQKEMESVVTRYLKNIDAYLEPRFHTVPISHEQFPVEASVIIPVRNRASTITAAIQSALAQETSFHFNVIVVDNHSTDGTTSSLRELANLHPMVKHLTPSRRDLNIGGCWNEAVFSPFCGRFAVQLDSDDIYSSPETLQTIIDVFGSGDCAMVIGSYTLVNEKMEEIPPGLIDHREWTDDNGHNNALRINGLGAPRAFHTGLLRTIGFPNIHYGEDYAVALRLSRYYRIGRIYKNLYYCRRWEGNTDFRLTIEQKNRNDLLKDRIRTVEILARQKMNREKSLR